MKVETDNIASIPTSNTGLTMKPGVDPGSSLG